MSFPVIVEAQNGYFVASLIGVPTIKASELTRNAAIESLKKILEEQVNQGTLIELEIGKQGIAAQAGAFADDPTLREICEEAYRLRDEEAQSLQILNQ